MHAATLKSTWGAALGSVATSATTITTTIEAAGEGSAMLLAYAREQREQQAKDIKLRALNGDYLAQQRSANQLLTVMRETASLNLTDDEQLVWNAAFARAGEAIGAKPLVLATKAETPPTIIVP